ncbi:MAG: hypothetical protein Q9169_002553 [Polycauliona sp. 2 TL-2023]
MSGTSVVRPLGMLEKLYPARQVLGVYHSVIVAAAYNVPMSIEETTLRAVIPGLLRQHPSLCCCIEGGDTAEPKFARLHTINAKDVLRIVHFEQGQKLAEKLQELHDEPWPMVPKPLWKLVVMKEPQAMTDSRGTSTLHIALVYHHVIGDGLSGKAFHQSLLRELNGLERRGEDLRNAPESIRTSSLPRLIKPIEKLISFPLSWKFLVQKVAEEYTPSWLFGGPTTIWAGLPNKTLDELPYRTRVRIASINAEDLEFLLVTSREHGVSLTSLVTGAIALALATKLPAASAFSSITPYTLRRVTGTSMAEMVNQSTGLETTYSADVLDRIRQSSNVHERRDSLWTTATWFHGQMQSELTKCPMDNLVGLLPYVIDPVAFYRKKFGRAREATWEFSNLGAFTASPGPSSATWKVDSMIFTQGAQPVGSAFTVNGISVQDRSLTLAITWQDQVVDEDVIDAVADTIVNLPSFLER